MDNPNCGRCGHLNMRGDCNLTACMFPMTKTEVLNIKKPMTKADRIRSKTDEELAELVCDSIDCSICEREAKSDGCPAKGRPCYNYWLDWLKQEE